MRTLIASSSSVKDKSPIDETGITMDTGIDLETIFDHKDETIKKVTLHLPFSIIPVD